MRKCLNLIKFHKTLSISIKGDDGRLPVDHPRGHGDEDEDCSEGQPTPASRKQHRLEPLIRCRKPFIGIYIHTCVFACNPFFITNLSFANINPLSNTFIENNKEQSIFVRCIICLIRFGENIFLLPRLLLREPCCDAD